MRRNYYRRQAGKDLSFLGLQKYLPVKIGKGGEKRGSGKGFQMGKPKGKKGEEMPIFVGFNLFLPLFPLGLSPLGTSVKQTNLVKVTCDLNNSPKIKAAPHRDCGARCRKI